MLKSEGLFFFLYDYYSILPIKKQVKLLNSSTICFGPHNNYQYYFQNGKLECQEQGNVDYQ